LEYAFYYIIGLIIVGFFLSSILNYLIMPLIVRKGQEVIVPDVIGLNQDSAVKILKNYYLTPIIDTMITSSAYPKGTVIEEDPNPNYRVKKGRKVFLTVSGGIELVEVPNVIGKNRSDAEDILKSIGFEVEVDYLDTKGTESDIVLDMSPSPTSKIPRGSKIKLTVSRETL
jgi:beta-lactam-binding protein with PASTA domain